MGCLCCDAPRKKEKASYSGVGWRLEEKAGTPEVGRKQVTPGWAGEQKGRHAPRKQGKASYSEVSCRDEEKACTPEAGKSKLFRGELSR